MEISIIKSSIKSETSDAVIIGIFPKLIFGSTNDAVVSLLQVAFGG